jgi:hypothetical protein
VLHANARDEVLQNARVMMESANASGDYTNAQVRPLLETQLKYKFIPQSVPAFAATEQFNELRKNYPDYTFKAATLNPTNPRNHATDWEIDIVNQFRQSSAKNEVIGERATQTGRSLYLARPIQIKDPACLTCHSTPDAAPRTMVETYGSANGFGWKVNEIVGANIVSVPTSVPVQRANYTFRIYDRHAKRYALLVRHPSRQATVQARGRGEPWQPGRGRVPDEEQGRDRRADRSAWTDEDQHGAGDQDAGCAWLSAHWRKTNRAEGD